MNKASNKAAFTLIELLVVISIILIATSILFVGGGGGSDGIKLSSAQRVVSTIAQGARGNALLENSEARLIIYSDANTGGDPEKFLRYFGIVYWGEDVDGAEGWLAATQGTYLPEGIYFNPELSSDNPYSAWAESNTMTLDFPRVKAGANTNQNTGGGSDTYYYYGYNSNGTMATGFENAWLVLQAGTLIPDNSPPIAFDEEEKASLLAALIFRRVGTTTAVTDPADITVDSED